MYTKCTAYGKGAFLWCVLVRVSLVQLVFLSVVYVVVQNNVARGAFRGATIIPQYVTLFALGQL